MEGNTPAPTELKKTRAMKCFSLEPPLKCMCWLGACTCVLVAVVARDMSDNCRGRCTLNVHTMYYMHYLQAACALVQL